MTDETRIPVPEAAKAGTHCDLATYEAMYARSVDDPDGFWREQVARLDWIEVPTVMGNWSFDPVSIKWFEDGVLNASVQCLDRHLATRGDQVAILWEADSPDAPSRTLSYRELHAEVCRM